MAFLDAIKYFRFILALSHLGFFPDGLVEFIGTPTVKRAVF